jgi:hypothetical protein
MHAPNQSLSGISVKNGVSLRGETMTRIEVFSDAAFAFAVTLLVISSDGIPRDYGEFMEAMSGIPTFVFSFSVIMGYWLVHRNWSQVYGLEEPVSTILTLVIVVDIMIFVYPLKMIMSLFSYFISRGRLQTEFSIASTSEVTGLVIAFSCGLLVLGLAFEGLYWRAMSLRHQLKLNDYEVLRTREQMVIWAIVSGSTALALILALLLDSVHGYRGAYMLFLPPLLIPLVKLYHRQLVKRQFPATQLTG